MKFTPRALPPDAADASAGQDRHPLRELALLVGGIAVGAVILYLVFILIADIVVQRISPSKEARWFAAFAEALPEPAALTPELKERQATAQCQLKLLLPKADLKGLPVRLRVWDNETTNAIALPGGTIAVTKGLLQSLQGEPGMAFVLAHELGHFHGRDHLRGLSRQIGLQTVLALLFSGNSDVQWNAGQVGRITFLAYSRQREAAADRYAMKLMHDTMGSGDGATLLFELLQKDRLPSWAYMFQTHPDTETRINEMRQYAAELSASQ